MRHNTGEVALLAAARVPRFACVVAYFPCTNLVTWPGQVEQDGIRHYLDGFVRPEDIARCSPLHVARDITAPTPLIRGDQDTQVPIGQSEAMIAANPDIRLRRVAGGEHGLWKQWEEFWPEVLAFIERHPVR